jgi:hypothetical protein
MENNEEFKKAMETLQKMGLYVTLETHIHTNKFCNHFKEEMEQVENIIRTQQNFNAKDNDLIADTITEFMESLKMFSKNGSDLFDKIVLENDDTIYIKGYVLTENKLTNKELKKLTKMVDDYGEDIIADEHTLEVDEKSYGLVYYTIRLWWD